MILKLENVSKSYNGVEVLKNINLDLENKNTVAIIGPSGGGKSTLLNILSGYIEATSGYIKVNENVLEHDEKFLREYRKRVGIVFQSYNLFPHLTALRNITLILEKVHGYSALKSKERAEFLLNQFKLYMHKDKLPIQLSGGQQQRLAIIRALSYNPEILFFDEPSAALDPELTFEVLSIIKELKYSGANFVIVTHEMGFARHLSDYTLFLSDGVITEAAVTKELFENPKTDKLKAFLSSVLEWK